MQVMQVETLVGRLGDEALCVLDASWHMPAAGRNALKEFKGQHIEGAGFFDLDDCADKESDFPHMLPTAAQFQRAMRALGVNAWSDVVVYDSVGLFSAARLAWMLRVFGHASEKVFVLDGGLPAWKAKGLPVDDEPTVPALGDFVTRADGAWLVGFEEMQVIVRDGAAQVLDARSPNRFAGLEAEPRAGVKAGHMAGAINVHYASLLQADGRLKATHDLRALFDAVGVDLSKPIVTSCGSGVTAAMIGLALSQLGVHDWRLYDGSWAEWGLQV